MNALFQYILRWLGGISADQWRAAVQLVITAAKSQMASNEKLRWVAERLDGVGVTGSAANWLAETAYQWAKKFNKVPQ